MAKTISMTMMKAMEKKMPIEMKFEQDAGEQNVKARAYKGSLVPLVVARQLDQRARTVIHGVDDEDSCAEKGDCVRHGDAVVDPALKPTAENAQREGGQGKGEEREERRDESQGDCALEK